MAPPRQSIRARRRAFTLIELIVSLVAGLIVAIGVMGVSKEATSTFHEEVRIAGAEMGLRIAMERIRLDLQRAAFMGTGNIAGDPMIARALQNPGPFPNLSNFTGGVIPYSLMNLSGIALRPGGALVNSDVTESPQLALPGNQLPAGTSLAPDQIDIAGNMSSSDEYPALLIRNPPNPGACSPAFALGVEMGSPSGWRLRNAESALGNSGAALWAAFHPGTSNASSFLIRLTDITGHYQYLVGCAGGAQIGTSYSVTGPTPTATVYLAPVSTVLQPSQTGSTAGGVSGFSAGGLTISPLQVARWEIQTPAQLANTSLAVAGQYAYNATSAGNTGTTVYSAATGNAAGVALDQSNFLLTRSYLDFSGVCTGAAPCPVDPTTTEVIAEYAVDLKFGVTIDNLPNSACAAFPCANTMPTYTSNPLVNVAMDTMNPQAGGPGAWQPWIANTLGTYAPGVGPQRIRDVQVRVSIRSPFGDRAQQLLPPTSSSALDLNYRFRYQLDATSLHFQPGANFARVRTGTTEVTLPNQARFYW
jgi:type II secretory pathway pseudopilin PulG